MQVHITSYHITCMFTSGEQRECEEPEVNVVPEQLQPVRVRHYRRQQAEDYCREEQKRHSVAQGEVRLSGSEGQVS